MLDNFFEYFFQDIGNIFSTFFELIVAIFDFAFRFEMIRDHSKEFTFWEWALTILVNIILIAIIVLMLYGIYRLIRKIFHIDIGGKKYRELEKKVRSLQRDLLRANYEKDRLLAMKVAELGGDGTPASQLNMNDEDDPNAENAENGENADDTTLLNQNRNRFDGPCIDPAESRFFRLTSVDNYYKTEYVAPAYDGGIELEEFCERFRAYAASQLKLYYNIDIIRYFVASLGTARIIILQGISGTGKTSLPYAFGKFVQKDTTVVSVQPSWRERTELYGYYNEFTKKYAETDFLRSIYEGNYYRDPHLVILDEMNIARVEYYFAEFLSVLEMPDPERRLIEIVSDSVPGDPERIIDGKVKLPENMWYIGTANNDDSTMAISDKVYDRAMIIDLDRRALPFDAPEVEAYPVSYEKFASLIKQAKRRYGLTLRNRRRIEQLDSYLIENLGITFGNRIMRQIEGYVPVYVACGGSELEAIDTVLAKKVLRKLESKNPVYVRNAAAALSLYLDELFGEESMPICRAMLSGFDALT